jgi:hypothetical protein
MWNNNQKSARWKPVKAEERVGNVKMLKSLEIIPRLSLEGNHRK